MGTLTPVVVAAVIVFVINAVGRFIEFNNRFVNALGSTRCCLPLSFGALVYFAQVDHGVRVYLEFAAHIRLVNKFCARVDKSSGVLDQHLFRASA